MRELNVVGNLVIAAGAYWGGAELLALSGATLAAPTLIGSVVVGGVVIVGGSAAYYGLKTLLTTKVVDPNEVIEREINRRFTAITSSSADNRHVLTLDDEHSNELINRLNKWTKENKHKKIYLEKFKIQNVKISSKSWKKLNKMHIFKSGVEVLSIENQNSIEDLSLGLANAAKRLCFKSLTEISLVKCGIGFNDLENISCIGKESKVTTLNLAGNIFFGANHDPELWDDFVRNLYRNFPYADKLILKECGLNDKSLNKLLSFINNFSAIKILDLSANEFFEEHLVKVLESETFQSNLSLQHLKHDFPDSNRINQAIEKRNIAVETFLTNSGLTIETNLPFEVVRGIARGNRRIMEAIDKHIESTISNKLDQRFKKLEWRLWAEKCQAAQPDGNLSHEAFIEVIRTNEIELPSQMELIATDKVDILKNCVTGQVYDFNVNDNDTISLQYVAIGEILLNEFRELKKEGKSPILRNISLSKLGLTDDHFIELCETYLGDYQTSSLDLSQNNLTEESLTHCFDPEWESFKNLKSLNLSGNQLTINALPALLTFCRDNKVEKLSLANNPLGVQSRNMQALSTILCEFAKLPNLKQLDISDIGINERDYVCLAPVLCQQSTLENLNISQKNFNVKMMTKLLGSPGFINNLGLSNVTTGYDAMKCVTRLFDKKQALSRTFERSMSHEEKQRPITHVILDRFLTNQAHPDIPGNLKAALQKPSHPDKPSAWDAYQGLAAQMLYRGLKPRFTVEEFSEYLKNIPDMQEVILHNCLSGLKSAENEERIQLKLNVEKANVTKDIMLEKLCQTLRNLNDRTPIINSVELRCFNLNDDDICALFEENILGYKIEALDLSDNQLTDATLNHLINHIEDLTHLKALNLSNNQFTGTGLLKFAKACKKLNIETLILDGNPLASDQESQNAFQNFTQHAHHIMPQLKKLSLRDTLCESAPLSLLAPLFSQPALLQDLNIHQKHIRQGQVYFNMLKQPMIRGNVCIQDIDTGKNNNKQIQAELASRSRRWQHIECGATKMPQATERVYYLLDAYINGRTEGFVAEFKDWLNKINESVSGALIASPGDKLKFMANQIQYYRDRAKMLGVAQPEEAVEGEYLALKRNRLHTYWNLLNDKPKASQQLTVVKAMYKDKIEQSSKYKGLVLAEFTNLNMSFSVIWGQDDTIRVVNHHAQKQFIIHRYLEALTLNLDQARHYVLIDNIMNLSIDAKGVIKVTAGKDVLATVKGAEAKMVKHAMTHFFDSEKYEVQDSLAAVMKLATGNVNAAQESLFQFNQQRQNIPSMIPQKGSTQSTSPQSSVNLRT